MTILNIFHNSSWRTTKLHQKLSVAIPASVVSDTPHLREKTAKIGLIARATAIFRVGEIIIYPDNPRVSQTADADLIATLLTYIGTPQYLRKRLFKITPELQYAGILPPLRTPHHPLNSKTKDLKVGEYRDGVVLTRTKEGMLIDIGVEQPALLLKQQLSLNKRVTLRVSKTGKQVQVEMANRDEITDYWGYTVLVERQPFGRLVKNRGFDLTVGTSRYGAHFGDLVEKMAQKWKEANTVLIAFGSPMQGLHEIVRSEGLSLDQVVDFVVNTIPSQGTKTVRTEEALIASLAIFNVHFYALG
jgi:predicted SPOUT superfamily RNA methylase MTH1